jgi:16S rRNA (cytosine967-C5)-methyltransferase
MSPTEVRAVLEGITACLGGARSEAVVRQALQSNPNFNNTQRAFVANHLHGVACLRARLAHLAQNGEPRWLLAMHLCEHGLSVEQAAQLCGVPANTLEGLRVHPPPFPIDEVQRLAVERSLPLWLASLWASELGIQDAHALACVTNVPGPHTLRANPALTTRDQLVDTLRATGWNVAPTLLSPWGVRVEGHVNVRGSEAWKAGLFEVQDEGSQVMALATGVTPGMTVLDACAGSGGKTLALAAMMKDQGTLHAFDVDGARLADLRGRTGRRGLRHVVVHEGVLPSLQADVVLVDAPCSSLGTLRRGPDVRWHLREEDVNAFPSLQREILTRATGCVKPGGLLLYVTCTLHHAENEGVAAWFLEGHPHFRTEAVLAAGLRGTPHLTLLPHVHGTDGFFGAAFRRDT